MKLALSQLPSTMAAATLLTSVSTCFTLHALEGSRIISAQPDVKDMKFKQLTFFLLLTLLLPAGILGGRAGAQAPEITVPAGFGSLFSAPGITVYEQLENDVDAEVFVQVVDLASGAQVKLLHGPIVEPGQGEGVYGGDNPRFDRQYLPTVWAEFLAEQEDAVCLVNGGYFRDTESGVRVNPTTLSFPLKRAGVVVSEGHDSYRFYRHRRMLALWPQHAEIMRLDVGELYSSTAAEIVVGLGERAVVRATERLGRTFIGVADGDADGIREIVLIYSGEAVTQQEAAATLRAFGALEIMMLDGGGSSQLFCEGQDVIQRSRPLPQTIITVPAGEQAEPGRNWQYLFISGGVPVGPEERMIPR